MNLFYILYSTILLTCALSCLITNRELSYQKDSFVHPLIILSLAYIMFFWGGRGIDVGNDTPVYYWWFEQLHSVQVEPLFFYLMAFIHNFTTQSEIFLLVVASLTVLFLYRASHNFSRQFNVDLPCVFILLLMNTATLSMFGSGIRQGLASAISFYCLSLYLSDRKLLKAVCISLVATLIHKSSVICIIAIVIFRIDLKYKYSLLLMFVAIIISQFNWINGFFEIIHSFLKSTPFSFYTERLLNSQVSGTRGLSLGFGVMFYTSTALAFIYTFHKEEKVMKLVNLYLLVPVILLVFHEYSELSARLTVIFKYAFPILLVLTAKKFVQKRFVLCSLIVMSYLLLLKGVLITNISSGFYTYSNWILS